MTPKATSRDELTPVEDHDLGGGRLWLKRDDLYRAPGGAPGGKARTCFYLAENAVGLVTASPRLSPQGLITATIGKALGKPVRIHTPTGTPGPELAAALELGGERIEHTPGYNGVISARAREDAKALGWREIPFGMETPAALEQTGRQVANLPKKAKRIVIASGSGMSVAGVLDGMRAAGDRRPILSVPVGAKPQKYLNKFVPGWEEQITLQEPEDSYHTEVEAHIGGVLLDPIYEAKCVPFLRPGDLFWIVGIRQTLAQPLPEHHEQMALDMEAPRRLKVSAAWLNKQVDCTLSGILTSCGAACCHSGPSDTRWPARAAPGEGNRPCVHLGPNGCLLGDARPATCHLYPLRIQRGSLVMHHRVMHGIPCGECAGRGPRAIEALDRNLRLLFGEGQVDELRRKVDAGEDGWLEVPESLVRALEREAEWEENNEVPVAQAHLGTR